jgi:hypothetical protein
VKQEAKQKHKEGSLGESSHFAVYFKMGPELGYEVKDDR